MTFEKVEGVQVVRVRRDGREKLGDASEPQLKIVGGHRQPHLWVPPEVLAWA
jgi:hypothetical protein